jgi:imidazolonepropionase
LFMQDKTGTLETGKQADILVFDLPEYKDLIYHFGVNQLEKVYKKGKSVILN